MGQPICTLHKVNAAKVVLNQKIIVFCPECAKKNMKKIVAIETKQASSSKLTKLEREKKVAISELWKGIVLSIYLLIIPFAIALFYPLSYSKKYMERVSFIYQIYYLHPISYVLIAFFMLLGLYYVTQAIKKISLIQQKKEYMIESGKELTYILDQFLSSNRIGILNDFIQGLRNRFERAYLQQEPMSKMSIRELQVFVVKSLKKLGYKNIQTNDHYDSFGIHFFAENNFGKHAISVVKDELMITMDDVHKIAIGRAYFDCSQCILITAAKLTEDAKELANQLYVDIWNQEKMDELLHENKKEEWDQYLENHYDYSDGNLNHYTNYELQRLRKSS